ncbi:hypothetical protein BTHI11S_00969 [Bosea thiooxidans]
MRVADMGGVGMEGGAGEARLQRRLQLAQLLRAEHLHPDAEFRLALRHGFGCGHRAGIAEGVEAAIAVDMAREAGAFGPRQPGRQRQPLKCGEPGDRAFIGFGPRGQDEADEPGQQAWQIGRANAERAERIGEEFRDLPEDPGAGDRQDVGMGDPAGIAAGRAEGWLPALDEQDLVPLVEKRMGDGDADDACPDDRDLHGRLRSFGAEGRFAAISTQAAECDGPFMMSWRIRSRAGIGQAKAIGSSSPRKDRLAAASVRTGSRNGPGQSRCMPEAGMTTSLIYLD